VTHLCACGCGEAPGKETSQFRVGHDAKHKSNLVRAVLASHDESHPAYIELEQRGWLKFLEKARNNGSAKRAERRAQAERDGLPMSALRITEDMDEDTVAGLIRHRKIVLRTHVARYDITEEETLEVASIRLVAEGEIDFYICEGWEKGVPISGALRTVRMQDIVGVLDS